MQGAAVRYQHHSHATCWYILTLRLGMFKLKYHQDFSREGTQKNAYSSYLFYIGARLFQLRQTF
jgi:hypothetical protein